jgi:hypothetical protein
LTQKASKPYIYIVIKKGDGVGNSMITADHSVDYQLKESAIIVVALAWVLALGSVVLAAIILCGWRGAKTVAFDYRHFKVTFWCR